jgi:hypothetical protein
MQPEQPFFPLLLSGTFPAFGLQPVQLLQLPPPQEAAVKEILLMIPAFSRNSSFLRISACVV